jgi:hypothetical protein
VDPLTPEVEGIGGISRSEESADPPPVKVGRRPGWEDARLLPMTRGLVAPTGGWDPAPLGCGADAFGKDDSVGDDGAVVPVGAEACKRRWWIVPIMVDELISCCWLVDNHVSELTDSADPPRCRSTPDGFSAPTVLRGVPGELDGREPGLDEEGEGNGGNGSSRLRVLGVSGASILYSGSRSPLSRSRSCFDCVSRVLYRFSSSSEASILPLESVWVCPVALPRNPPVGGGRVASVTISGGRGAGGGAFRGGGGGGGSAEEVRGRRGGGATTGGEAHVRVIAEVGGITCASVSRSPGEEAAAYG